VATLVDLRTAFDSVDRGILERSLEERGVSEGLRERIREVYEETRSVVKRLEVWEVKWGRGFGRRKA